MDTVMQHGDCAWIELDDEVSIAPPQDPGCESDLALARLLQKRFEDEACRQKVQAVPDAPSVPGVSIALPCEVGCESDLALAQLLHRRFEDRSCNQEARVVSNTPPVLEPGCESDLALARLLHRRFEEQDCDQEFQVVPDAPRAPEVPVETLARVAQLPTSLVSTVSPLYDICGTLEEPVVHVRNVDGTRGRLLAGRVLDALTRARRKVPAPGPGGREAILHNHWAKRRRRKVTGSAEQADQWKNGLHVLQDLADQLCEYLRRDGEALRAVPALSSSGTGGRGWMDTEVLVSSPGYKCGKHRDAQPPGSLLFIFCAGLSSRSRAWPNGKLLKRILESGDVLILDGTRTAHSVPEVLPCTSPFHLSPWLRDRRLSVLVRENPPAH